MNYKIRIILFFVLFVNVFAFSQQKIMIDGYVIDTDNRGVEMANVYIENTGIGVATNVNGYYSITTEVVDSVVIVYSMVGYKTVKHTVFSSQKRLHISVELQMEAREMKDFEVIARRRQTSMVDYIDHSKYRLMPNASGSFESILISAIGVTQNDGLSSQYNVRGGNFDENMVYVNGIEVYRPLLIRAGQQEGLSFINSDMVKTVGFSSGGFDALYGDKMSSALDITYKIPEKVESSVSLSLLGASAYVGTANSKFSQAHGIRYKTSSYLLGTLDTKGEYNPSFIDYQTYLTYQLSKKWEITFLGNFSQNSYRFIPKKRETDFGTYQTARNLTIFYEGQEKDLFQTAFGAFTFSFRPDDNLKLNFITSMFHTNEYETYDIIGEYVFSEVKMDAENTEEKIGSALGIGTNHEHARNRLKATMAVISHSGEYKTGRNLIKWGASFQAENIYDKISEYEHRDSAGYSLPYNDKVVNLYYSMKTENDLTSFRTMCYIQDTYRRNTAVGIVSFTGGIRANYWTFNNELLISPRVSASFVPAKKNFTFRLASGVYYQAPFYKEIRDTLINEQGAVNIKLNEAIKAQRSLHFLLGGDYYFRTLGRPFKFTTEAYLKLIDRAESYSVDNVRIRYSGENDAVAYTAGIDFRLAGELVPGADTWINFSLMRSKEKMLDEDFYQKPVYDNSGNITGFVPQGWVSRPNEQRYVFSMMFQDYLPNNPKYKLQLKTIYSDGLPFGAPRNPLFRSVWRSKAYFRVDIGASRVLASGEEKFMSKPFFKHFKNIWLNVEVFNVLDYNNVNSHYWITDYEGVQWATPNYLTGRQLNLKLIVDFK
jgi:TonB-dependent Receptor Plug Domain.